MNQEAIDTIKEYLAIAVAVLPFVVAFLTALVKQAKSAKAAKGLKNAAKIASAIQDFVIGAEQFLNFSGAEKKQWVIGRISLYAAKNKIPLDEAFVSDKIEDIVLLTKKVNARDKDKVDAEEVLK